MGPERVWKSNVVDAVKWCPVSSQRRACGALDGRHHLRRFREPQGHGRRRGQSDLEAGDEPFAGEFARCEEIQITRRLFRDGNSEYLINQSRCRLRDIQDIFRDTGASNRLYSFIEQGRIGEIVKAKL